MKLEEIMTIIKNREPKVAEVIEQTQIESLMMSGKTGGFYFLGVITVLEKLNLITPGEFEAYKKTINHKI